MPLFEDMTEDAVKKEQDKQNLEAMEAMAAFADDADKPDVIAVCEELTRCANELAEMLQIEPTDAILALLVGAGLQRAEVVKARDEQAEQKGN